MNLRNDQKNHFPRQNYIKTHLCVIISLYFINYIRLVYIC
jgi:hypothetical protein